MLIRREWGEEREVRDKDCAELSCLYGEGESTTQSGWLQQQIGENKCPTPPPLQHLQDTLKPVGVRSSLVRTITHNCTTSSPTNPHIEGVPLDDGIHPTVSEVIGNFTTTMSS